MSKNIRYKLACVVGYLFVCYILGVLVMSALSGGPAHAFNPLMWGH